VIESCWGDAVGQVIEKGMALDPIAAPPSLNGVGWGRFVRSETSGRFETQKDIGDYVEKGIPIGQLDGNYILAPITGYLRGLLFSGMSVIKGEKLCEIDPRQQDAHFQGLAERPKDIAMGVMKVVHKKWPDMGLA